ncbi:Dro/myosuppressin receptor [Paragonimus heterotremus]|uniref:Dro/myosuppressin receptor n=1 Tax=Paragonimus heterotremus TaxID=100268 RepID=A0A8J4T795_9TREM|nr:Dro/myosuppressin receptor [Paragonimus heterotremus]
MDVQPAGISFPEAVVSDSTSTCETIQFLSEFRVIYGNAHGYIAVILCLLAVLSNTFSVIVLNQASMISSTNFLLTMLAISDGILMSSYAVFAAYFLIGDHVTQSTYGWCVFMLVHINLQNLFHSTSSYIIVSLASFRVLYVRCLVRCHELCSMHRAKIAAGMCFLVSLILTIPCILSHHIVPSNGDGLNASSDQLLYMVTYVDDHVLVDYLSWNTAIFLKLLPLVCLTVLSAIIIVTILRKSNKMRRMKTRKQIQSISTCSNSQDATTTTPVNGAHDRLENGRIDRRSELASPTSVSVVRTRSSRSRASLPTTDRDRMETRMTRLLLAVVFIFIIALLPQAILLFLNGLLGNCFTDNVYNNLGDLTDLLTIVNSCINFVLYCSMSQQFRTTFLRLFCSWWMNRSAPRNTSLQTTAGPREQNVQSISPAPPDLPPPSHILPRQTDLDTCLHKSSVTS